MDQIIVVLVFIMSVCVFMQTLRLLLHFLWLYEPLLLNHCKNKSWHLAAKFCLSWYQPFEKYKSWVQWYVFHPKSWADIENLLMQLIAALISKMSILLYISRNFWSIWKKVNHTVPYAHSLVGVVNFYVHYFKKTWAIKFFPKRVISADFLMSIPVGSDPFGLSKILPLTFNCAILGTVGFLYW